MKKYLFLILIAAAALMFAGCDKKDADDELTPGVNEEIKDAPPYAASKKAWVFGDPTWSDAKTWSDAIHIPECNKSSFTDSYTNPQCRSNTDGTNKWYYYNWAYVNQNAATLCPSPWRVPTQSDFLALADAAKAFELISAWGYGGYANGSGMNTGEYANYWSSTELSGGSSNAYYLYFDTGGRVVPQYTHNKCNGLQVRCVK
jgi:hypothetical protein